MNVRTFIQILFRSPKLTLSAAGVILLYVVAWQAGIKKSVVLISRYSEISSAAGKQQQRARPEELLIRLENLDRQMGCSDLAEDEIRQSILEHLSQAGSSCPFKMVDIPAGYVYGKQGYAVMVNTFVLAGDYPDLLRLMYRIDTSHSSGRVISSRLFMHKTYQLSAPELRLALYFQHIKKKNGKL
jgi:hypothetical protein